MSLQLASRKNYAEVIREDEEYIYRTVAPEDIDSVKTLQDELFPVKYSEDFYKDLIIRRAVLTILAFHKSTQKLVGICSCKSCYEIEYRCCGCKKLRQKVGYIMTLGVSKQHRRKGLARTILELSEQQMYTIYKCEKLTLHCKVDNTDALSFYGSMRFYVDKFIENYYEINGQHEHAYHLGRDIQTSQIILDNENHKTRPLLASIFQIDKSSFHKQEIDASIANYTYPKWIPKENRYGVFSPIVKYINQTLENIDESVTWFYYLIIQVHLMVWEFLRRAFLVSKNYWKIYFPVSSQPQYESKTSLVGIGSSPEHGISVSLLHAEKEQAYAPRRNVITNREEALR